MASRKALLITDVIMAAVVVGALLPATASAMVFEPGYQNGWVVGVDYNAWASDQDFKVGDSLKFVYPKEEKPISNVLDEASYVACTVLSDVAVMLTQDTGDDTVELDAC